MAERAEALTPAPILSAKVGDNDVSFRDVASLYIKPTDIVLDLTYGYGRFWRKVETMPRRLIRADLDWREPSKHLDLALDYREPLPFRDASVHVVVYDPPYKFGTSHDMNVDQDGYGNNARPVEERGMAAVWRRYAISLEERIHPVLKAGGLVVLKGQDGVESGRTHLFLHSPALTPTPEWHRRWELVDLFVVVRKHDPRMRHTYQFHTRKNHSYFVVLRKRVQRPLRETPPSLFEL